MPLNKNSYYWGQQISRASEVLESKMQQPSYSEFIAIFNETEGWVESDLAHEASKCPLVYYICMYTVYTQKHSKFQKQINEVTAKRFSKNVMPI